MRARNVHLAPAHSQKNRRIGKGIYAFYARQRNALVLLDGKYALIIRFLHALFYAAICFSIPENAFPLTFDFAFAIIPACRRNSKTE